ncbi:hypothetical protein E4U55_002495 [Claviceps digitariae]|nr:hypothetical protein E4U55_002495 [Claviceps digitariae]
MQYLILLLAAAAAVPAEIVPDRRPGHGRGRGRDPGRPSKLNLTVYCADYVATGGFCEDLGTNGRCCRTSAGGPFTDPETVVDSSKMWYSYGHCQGDGFVYCV